MRIKSTDDREQLWESLCEATNEQARSKALDAAAKYYLKICGSMKAYGRGDVHGCSMQPKSTGHSPHRRLLRYSMSESYPWNMKHAHQLAGNDSVLLIVYRVSIAIYNIIMSRITILPTESIGSAPNCSQMINHSD